ncbi:MAG: DUF2378 family protein [Polyangiaceae bacterium]
MRAGFSLPSFSAPLDLDAEIAKCPSSATVKGMFIDAVQKRIRALNATPQFDARVVPFNDYSTVHQMRLLAQWARLAHRILPPREGLRRVGWSAYEDLTNSLAGRVLFGVLGRDIVAITKLASKAYAIAGSPQRATVVELADKQAIVRLEDIHLFIDSYQIGVMEGVLRLCRLEGSVLTKRLSETSCEMCVEWR